MKIPHQQLHSFIHLYHDDISYQRTLSTIFPGTRSEDLVAVSNPIVPKTPTITGCDIDGEPSEEEDVILPIFNSEELMRPLRVMHDSLVTKTSYHIALSVMSDCNTSYHNPMHLRVMHDSLITPY